MHCQPRHCFDLNHNLLQLSSADRLPGVKRRVRHLAVPLPLSPSPGAQSPIRGGGSPSSPAHPAGGAAGGAGPGWGARRGPREGSSGGRERRAGPPTPAQHNCAQMDTQTSSSIDFFGPGWWIWVEKIDAGGGLGMLMLHYSLRCILNSLRSILSTLREGPPPPACRG